MLSSNFSIKRIIRRCYSLPLINEFWHIQTSTSGAKSMWSATDKVKLYFNESKSFGTQCSEHSQFNDAYH